MAKRARVDDNTPAHHAVKHSVAERAMHLFKEVMPQKLVEIDSLWNSELFQYPYTTIIEENHEALNECVAEAQKRRKILADEEQTASNGTTNHHHHHHHHKNTLSLVDKDVPCHPIILRVIEASKGELLQLIDTLSTLKVWVQLSIPKIEDGGNFGVSVQEEVVQEVSFCCFFFLFGSPHSYVK